MPLHQIILSGIALYGVIKYLYKITLSYKARNYSKLKAELFFLTLILGIYLVLIFFTTP